MKSVSYTHLDVYKRQTGGAAETFSSTSSTRPRPFSPEVLENNHRTKGFNTLKQIENFTHLKNVWIKKKT